MDSQSAGLKRIVEESIPKVEAKRSKIDQCCYELKGSERLLSMLPNVSKVDNLKEMLIKMSGLDDDKSKLLRKLFRYISFKENAINRGKYQAIIAGSYPSFLAKAVRKYNDIDVFILWTTDKQFIDMGFVNLLYQLGLKTRPLTNKVALYAGISGIVKVVDIGKLQIIIKEHNACNCMLHVNSVFFNDFHHVTRWRLITFTNHGEDKKKHDVILPIYIPYREEEDILAKTILITPDGRNKYPVKHIDNAIHPYPPSLFQQAIMKVIKYKLTF